MLDYNKMTINQLQDCYTEFIDKSEYPSFLSWVKALTAEGRLRNICELVENTKKYKWACATELRGIYDDRYDMTIIVEEEYILDTDGSVRNTTAVVGWYHGEPDDELNEKYYGKTFGIIDFPAGEFDDEQLKHMGLLE